MAEEAESRRRRMAESPPLLRTENLESFYGAVQVLWGVDVTVREHERVVVLGANGAGKTTLLKTLLGLHPLTAGMIFFDGQRIESVPSHRRVAMGLTLMTESGVFPRLSIESNLWLGGYRLPKKQAKANIAAVYDEYPWLAARRRKPAGSLSGGQRKILAVEKALVGEPRVLVMDEPSAGLSPAAVKEVISTLRGSKLTETSLLLAEQNVAFLDLADRVAVIEGGRVQFDGSVAELNDNNALHSAFFGVSGASS